MELDILQPAIEAFGFVLGCMVIHGFRGHAERLTTGLGLVAGVLGCLVLIAALPPRALDLMNAAAVDPEGYHFGAY